MIREPKVAHASSVSRPHARCVRYFDYVSPKNTLKNSILEVLTLFEEAISPTRRGRHQEGLVEVAHASPGKRGTSHDAQQKRAFSHAAHGEPGFRPASRGSRWVHYFNIASTRPSSSRENASHIRFDAQAH